MRTFTRDGAEWSETDKLFGWDTTDGDHFGYSVAIAGGYVIAGAKYDDDNGSGSGAVYIYDGKRLTRKVVVPDGAANDHFGHAVAVNLGFAVAGAIQDNGVDSGAA